MDNLPGLIVYLSSLNLSDNPNFHLSMREHQHIAETFGVRFTYSFNGMTNLSFPVFKAHEIVTSEKFRLLCDSLPKIEARFLTWGIKAKFCFIDVTPDVDVKCYLMIKEIEGDISRNSIKRLLDDFNFKESYEIRFITV
jgi:hypothetical protein